MRMPWIMALAVFGLVCGATLVDRPAANQQARADELRQSSIMIDQLHANTKNLPVQAFDSF